MLTDLSLVEMKVHLRLTAVLKADLMVLYWAWKRVVQILTETYLAWKMALHLVD